MKNSIRAILVIIIFVLASFFTGCGSAEAIEQYSYSTSKPNLEKAVNNVLKSNSNPNVIWDTIRPSRYDSTLWPGFNWITIKEKEIEYNYGFDYLGGKNEWATSSSSTICIDLLWNNKGLYLKQGENVGDFSSHEAKAAKSLFEKEFVNKLDKELNLKHSTGRSFWQ